MSIDKPFRNEITKYTPFNMKIGLQGEIGVKDQQIAAFERRSVSYLANKYKNNYHYKEQKRG